MFLLLPNIISQRYHPRCNSYWGWAEEVKRKFFCCPFWLSVSLRQNSSLDQFFSFFWQIIVFLVLDGWLQNSFSKGERADGHPFLFKSIEPKLHERCQFRRENLYIMSNESMLALSKCDKPHCCKKRTKLDYWNPKPNSTMNSTLSLLLYLSLHKAFRHDLAMTTSRREKRGKARGLVLLPKTG